MGVKDHGADKPRDGGMRINIETFWKDIWQRVAKERQTWIRPIEAFAKIKPEEKEDSDRAGWPQEFASVERRLTVPLSWTSSGELTAAHSATAGCSSSSLSMSNGLTSTLQVHHATTSQNSLIFCYLLHLSLVQLMCKFNLNRVIRKIFICILANRSLTRFAHVISGFLIRFFRRRRIETIQLCSKTKRAVTWP